MPVDSRPWEWSTRCGARVTALVHTAAASNLGQMLHRLCSKENIKLVNIVRSDDQETLLRGIGATYVCNTQSSHFIEELTDAITATAATIAFDTVGGGPLAGQILRAMEVAASKTIKTYSRYGSTIHKQVYLFGGLDPRPAELVREYGMAWAIGGWLVMNFVQRVGPVVISRLKELIASELRTTFLRKYSNEISLVDMLQLDDRGLPKARDRAKPPGYSEQSLGAIFPHAMGSHMPRIVRPAPDRRATPHRRSG